MDFSGIWIPLVTPLHNDSVDLSALSRLVKHLAAQGVAGFVPCGSTGEAAMLSIEEQQQVLATTLQAAGGRPVICGVAGARPQAVLASMARLAEAASDADGLKAFLLTAPAYVKPSQAGIEDFFRQVADAAPRPVAVYDIPSRTGVRIETATLQALADHPRIVAVKDCSGDRAAADALLADGRLAWLAGNDDELFDQLARGAPGAIVATAHLATADFVALQRAFAQDRLDEARALWRRLAPLTRDAFAEPNPAPLKAALARQGWLDNELRTPMRPAAAATAEALLSRL